MSETGSDPAHASTTTVDLSAARQFEVAGVRMRGVAQEIEALQEKLRSAAGPDGAELHRRRLELAAEMTLIIREVQAVRDGLQLSPEEAEADAILDRIERGLPAVEELTKRLMLRYGL
jgi:hypothetical protein